MKEKKRRNSILVRPTPLINLEKKYVILWSAKSGCTFVLKWFYMQNDIKYSRREGNYTGWHDHRIRSFYKSDDYKNAIKAYTKDSTEFKHIKIVRNPFERTASAYLHLLKKAHQNHPMAKDYLGVDDIPSDFNMSFEEFLNVLSTKNVRIGNAHWRSQTHHLERAKNVKLHKVINLNNSFREFRELELELGLKKSSKSKFDKLRKNRHHSKKSSEISTAEHKPISGFVGNISFNHELALKRPEYKDFYNEKLENIVFDIYQEDFKRYKFNPKYL